MPRNPNKAVLLFALLLASFCVGFWAWQPGASRELVPDLPAAAIASVTTTQVRDPLNEPALPADEPSASTTAAAREQPAPVLLATNAPRTIRPDNRGITPVSQRTTRQQTVVFQPLFTSYTIRAGETSFEAISRRIFGTSKHALAIARANPLTSPDKLRAGQTLLIPKDPSNIQGRVGTLDIPTPTPASNPAPSPAPTTAPGTADQARTHTVAPGETLSDIAQRYYGTASRWREILEANRDKLARPERVRIGMVLRIP